MKLKVGWFYFQVGEAVGEEAILKGIMARKLYLTFDCFIKSNHFVKGSHDHIAGKFQSRLLVVM